VIFTFGTTLHLTSAQRLQRPLLVISLCLLNPQTTPCSQRNQGSQYRWIERCGNSTIFRVLAIATSKGLYEYETASFQPVHRKLGRTFDGYYAVFYNIKQYTSKYYAIVSHDGLHAS